MTDHTGRCLRSTAGHVFAGIGVSLTALALPRSQPPLPSAATTLPPDGFRVLHARAGTRHAARPAGGCDDRNLGL